MNREIHKWYSPNLNKEWEIAVYGHYGTALLMFPTAAADYLEYERFNLIESISPYIQSGKFKAFSINSINSESWLNENIEPKYRGIRHQQYNDYIVNEVVPFIFKHCKGEIPIITTGASLGALHAANTLFRRPDIFHGTIAMSGSYDLKHYTKGYYDDNVYFNSPVDYLSNLTDQSILTLLRSRKNIYIVTGQGDYENPEASRHLSNILSVKEIPHELDIWGYDIPHDWSSWKKMLPYFLEVKF